MSAATGSSSTQQCRQRQQQQQRQQRPRRQTTSVIAGRQPYQQALSLLLAPVVFASRITSCAGAVQQVNATAGLLPGEIPSWVFDSSPVYAVIFPWVVEILGVVVFFLLKHYEIPVPYAACMFALGVLMGAGAVLTESADQLSISIYQWSNINSDVLLLIFLPGLLVKDAIEVNINLFMVAAWQIFLLAYPAVLVGTILVALVGVYILPYMWSWALAACLGAILSSTDPVAVAAVLKSAGAPPRILMHIAGESLLNDGSSYVFYKLFGDIFLYELGLTGYAVITVGEGVKVFFKSKLWTLLLSIVVYIISIFCRSYSLLLFSNFIQCP